MEIINEIVGWSGFGFILLAYFLNTNNYLSNKSKIYQILNILGAIGLGYVALLKDSWPNFFLEVVWFGIAFWGLYNIYKKK